MAKRPSLATVMDKGAEQKPDMSRSVALQDDQAQAARTQRKPGKKSLGWVQLNMYVPEELRTKVKIKALQADRDVSEIVTELLEAWAEED